MDTLARFDLQQDVFGLGTDGWLPHAVKAITLLARSVKERDDRQALFLCWQLSELASLAGAVSYAGSTNAIESAIRSGNYVRAQALAAAVLEQMETATVWLDRRARLAAKHGARFHVQGPPGSVSVAARGHKNTLP